mmetsp:Transcript_13180/g.11652  ORF Transcript_13180/g.11652 Transcript_13180/m.11652 type:complete len:285 (-) Transcript_13180:20-874(-)
MSSGQRNQSINSSKGTYKLKRSDKSFASMLQLNDINSSKNYYRNGSFRNRGSLNNKCNAKTKMFLCHANNFSHDMKTMKTMKKNHSKHSNKNNIILDDMKSQKSKNKKLRKFKRNKDRKASEFIIPLGSNYKLKKILQDSNLILPITVKKSQHSEMRGSRERRSHRRSKPKNKWKASPYKKKLASKLQKLKTLITDTPNSLSHVRRKNKRISEYSNFIHGGRNKTNTSIKSSTSNKKKSSDSRSIDKKFSKGDNLQKLLVKGNSRNRHRSKTKSDKFTFLTINN